MKSLYVTERDRVLKLSRAERDALIYGVVAGLLSELEDFDGSDSDDEPEHATRYTGGALLYADLLDNHPEMRTGLLDMRTPVVECGSDSPPTQNADETR